MPPGAKILCIEVVRGEMMLVAFAGVSTISEERTFALLPVGDPIPANVIRFIGTAAVDSISPVSSVYELMS
jgi:hypothetical protein